MAIPLNQEFDYDMKLVAYTNVRRDDGTEDWHEINVSALIDDRTLDTIFLLIDAELEEIYGNETV